MSLYSGTSRQTTPSSILRKTSSYKSRLTTPRAPIKVRFSLPYAKRVRTILHDLVTKQSAREYEQLICLIRDSELVDNDLKSLLDEATQCISLLNNNYRLFVEAILAIKWSHRGKKVVSQYQSFLVDLLAAHNYHAKIAIDYLVANFEPDINELENDEITPSQLKRFNNIHTVLKVLLEVIPLSKEILMQSVINRYPYIKKPTHCHEIYLYNLIEILKYHPQFRPDFLHLIVSKLILLDVSAPREEIERVECGFDDDIFPMEEDYDEDSPNMKHPVAHTLDVCLNFLFSFFEKECLGEQGQLEWEKMKKLYHNMIIVFDKVVLPTYNIHHVQYLMFYLCSFKPTITEAFLNYLWKKFCDPSVPSVLRQTAVVYIGSLISRGAFVPLSMLKGTLQQMAGWIHSYIMTQDGLECINSNVRVHAVFYSICQALLYVIAFRHKDLVDTKKNVIFLQSLNLTKIITCRLNPLRVCQVAVAQNFAAITRKYQLVYCYSVIEHNARNMMTTVYQDDTGSYVITDNVLDSFFPFDPFILKRSGTKISPFYVEYQDFVDNTCEVRESEGDDFLSESEAPCHSDRFSYGTSPGFKMK